VLTAGFAFLISQIVPYPIRFTIPMFVGTAWTHRHLTGKNHQVFGKSTKLEFKNE
jgi:hypothetical protein